MNSPIQNFVWGNNKRDGVFPLPTITFKGHLRIDTRKYPNTNRKLRFEMHINKSGITDHSRYSILYNNGTFQVRYADTPRGYAEVPLSDVGSVFVRKFDKLNNIIFYEIEFNFTYEVRNGRIIRGIRESEYILSRFTLNTYTDPTEHPTSMPFGVDIEENPRNFNIIAELGEIMSPTQNIFGYRAEWFPNEPSTLKTIPNLYGTNTISVSYTNL